MPKDLKNRLQDVTDVRAEGAILGTLLGDLSSIAHCDLLKVEHFSDPINQCIYQAIQDIYSQDISNVNDITLYTQLASDKTAQTVFSKARMNLDFVKQYREKYMLVGLNDVSQLQFQINRVMSLSFKRDLFLKLNKHEEVALDPTKDNVIEITSQITSDLDNLNEKYILSESSDTFDACVDELWESVISKRGVDGTYGIPSKFNILNQHFTYEPGELYIISARMKQGKSAFCLNELVHKLDNDIPCLYLDTEMSPEMFFTRLISNKARVDWNLVKTGEYSSDEEHRVKQAIEWIKQKGKIFCHRYEPVWTEDKIYTVCKTMHHKIGFKFMVYDYMKDTKTVNTGEKSNVLGNLCNFLKNDIAGRFDVAVLSAAQLNRNGAIADSDKIEMYITLRMQWSRKDEKECETDGKNCGNYKLSIPTSRVCALMSEDDYFDFRFIGNQMLIEEAKIQHDPFAWAD
jgi:replicative DNA helicase